MTAALERIKECLDRLEATPINTDSTPLENVSVNYKYLSGRNNLPLCTMFLSSFSINLLAFYAWQWIKERRIIIKFVYTLAKL